MQTPKKLTIENLMDGTDLFVSDTSFFNKAVAVIVSAGLIGWAIAAYVLCWLMLSAVTRDQFLTIGLAKILTAFGGGTFKLHIASEQAGAVIHGVHKATILAGANATFNSAWPKVLFFILISSPSFVFIAHHFKIFLAKKGAKAAKNIHLRGALVVDAEKLNEEVLKKNEDEIIRRAIVLEKRMQGL